jgi:undecaprenyl-diphosphatase
MSELEALLLGIVQGLTEFLPISSSGHLILVPWLQDYTFLQTHDDLWVMLKAGLRSIGKRSIDDSDERLAWTIVVGTIPAVIVGGLFGGYIEDYLGEPWLIGIGLILFGLILWWADRRPQRKALHDAKIRDGVWIGIAQAFALSPGTSRSGVTISAARFLGFDRDAAARISFLLLVPATAGAAVYKGVGMFGESLPDGVVSPMIVGMIGSAVSGYLAIAWLLAFVRKRSYDIFVAYRLIAGFGVLLLIATGVRAATF